MNRKSLPEICTAHHVEDSETGKLVMDDSPPLRVRRNSIIEYSAPGKHFVTFSLDSIDVWKTFLISCKHRAIVPLAWIWDYVLSKDLDILETDDYYVVVQKPGVSGVPDSISGDYRQENHRINGESTLGRVTLSQEINKRPLSKIEDAS